MIRTTLEEVVRNHCDTCGKDITFERRHQGPSGGLGGFGDPEWETCSDTFFDMENGRGIVVVSCADLARFNAKYPQLRPRGCGRDTN